MKQVSGLQEDNDRIARMYTMVQNVATKKLVDEEASAPNLQYAETMKKDKAEQKGKQGWTRIDDDGFGGNLSSKKT